MKHTTKLVCASMTLIGACADAPMPAPAPGARPPELDAAHEAYLAGDWLGVTTNVRAVLLDTRAEPAVRDNAIELLDKAYEVAGGRLPADWAAPAGIDRLRYVHTRVAEKEGDHHRINFAGRAADGIGVAQIRVTRAPDEVLLDRRAGVGQFFSEDEGDGHFYFEMESDELPALPPPGVYTVTIELAGGARSEGWFLVDRLTSDAAPEIVTPTPAAALRGPFPELGWRDFRSPEYLPFEARSLGVYLIHRDADGRVVSPWSLWTEELADERGPKVGLTMGRDRLADKEWPLEGGDYCVALTFGEARTFGPVRLVRASRRVQHFSVEE